MRAKPYSQETHGDLESYLHERRGCDNLFHGDEPFQDMMQKGLVVPGITTIRVNRSPAPDFIYVVNKDFLLESANTPQNMSTASPKPGICQPEKVLYELWSVYGLKL
jgi:hypothetical protein